MADLAAANLATGDAARARTLIEEAQAFADRSGAHMRVARIPLVRAQILRESEGAAARDQIEATLTVADASIAETGACAWQPFVMEERARLARLIGDQEGAERHLREARHLFQGFGATGHARRLAD